MQMALIWAQLDLQESRVDSLKDSKHCLKTRLILILILKIGWKVKFTLSRQSSVQLMPRIISINKSRRLEVYFQIKEKHRKSLSRGSSLSKVCLRINQRKRHQQIPWHYLSSNCKKILSTTMKWKTMSSYICTRKLCLNLRRSVSRITWNQWRC